jgi:hypothetical protein
LLALNTHDEKIVPFTLVMIYITDVHN